MHTICLYSSFPKPPIASGFAAHGFLCTQCEVAIPTSVVAIGEYAFMDCCALLKVMIPLVPVESIGNGAFKDYIYYIYTANSGNGEACCGRKVAPDGCEVEVWTR